MIRNGGKIAAIIENARMCRDIAKKHGSIDKWVKSIQNENKKEPLFKPTVRDEMQRFVKIGHTTSRWLAYVVTRDRDLLEEDFHHMMEPGNWFLTLGDTDTV